jgi:glycosyltransferase involved in cell wall biosynthesis
VSLGSWQVIGSRDFGGADQFYCRLVQALQAAGDPVLAVNRSGSPVGRVLGDAVPQLRLPFANQWDLYTAWRLRATAARDRPPIVQTYMGRATRLTRLPAGGPSVHVARLGGFYKVRGYYEHAHAWIGNTRGVCDHLLRAGLPADRVFRIGNFVPPPEPVTSGEAAVERARQGIPADARVLFALGRLVPGKGFEDLLDAFALLPAELGGRPLHLAIGGDGPLGPALRARAGARVHWLGWLAQPGPWYALADVLVVPSRHETLGNVILEAWSYARPVVSTATAGAVELVEPGVSGLLVPVADAAALAATVHELLLATDEDRGRLGRAGADCVAREHSEAAVLAAYRELYRDLYRRRVGA